MNRLRHWLALWRESADPHIGLDSLLSRARPDAAVEERLEWLHDLVAWLLAEHERDEAVATRSPQTVRLQHLLNVLERNPERALSLAATLRVTLAERDALDLLTETGLPREAGVVGEMLERLMSKVLPAPTPRDLAALFVRIFPDRDGAARLEAIAPETWQAAVAVLALGDEGPAPNFRARLARSSEDALELLAIQVSATTQASAMRSRMESAPGVALPTELLPFIVERLVAARRSGSAASAAVEHEALRVALKASLAAVENGYATLDRKGVSIQIVYQLERVRGQLQRLEELAQILADAERAPPLLRYFLASLVRDVHDHRDVLPLVRQTFSLVSRKIVERNAETGEHYIARDPGEYLDIFRRAVGGGFITAVTVHAKLALAHLKVPAFFEALLASVNYSVSFLAIQFAGFTLATKQPAMTAPALAKKMKGLEEEPHMGEFVDEVANLVRSQVAAILGNLLAVAPVAVAIYLLLTHLGQAQPMDNEKAHEAIASFSIAGPALAFAAFTGVLLWLSSVIAGWADNWFYFRELGPAFANHRRLRHVFGPTGAQRIAAFLEGEVAGIAGNLSLGIMLGTVPVLMVFLGIPLDVRHVTLSTGQLAVAVATLGREVLSSGPFWLAAFGIVGIGVLNLGVSFGLALAVALRARALPALGRRAVYGAILRRMGSQPLSFLYARRR